MNKRKTCTFKNCNNPVMKGPLTGRYLSVCEECFNKPTLFQVDKKPEEEETVYETSLGWYPFQPKRKEK